jgi:hypothetical protein
MSDQVPNAQPGPDAAGHSRLPEWVGAGVLVAVGVALFASRESAPLAYVIQRCVELGVAASVAAVLVALLAWFGLLMVPRNAARELTRTECAIMGGVACASLLSALTLLLGVAGLLTSGVAWGVLCVLFVLSLGVVRRRGLPPASPPPAAAAEPWRPLHLALAAGVALAWVPLVASAFAPPLVYDVTEYHLGALRDYLAGGRLRFVPMPHNFYARFPFPVEALYALGALLEHPNDFAPKLLNLVSVVGLCALVWHWLLRTQVRRTWRLIALLALVGHPVLLEVSLDAYIDAPVTLVILATVYGLVLTLKRGPAALSAPAQRALLPLVALLAGAMCVAKYTAAQLYLVPLALAFGGPVWRSLRHSSRRTRWLCALLFLVPPCVWLGKNVAFYANPFEPFFCWIFTPRDAAAVAREKFYIAAHYPQPLWTLAYWTTLVPRLEAFGWFQLASLIALVQVGRRGDIRRLVAVVVLSYLLWNLVRYSQDRFLLASIALVIILVATAMNELPALLARGVVAGALVLAAAAPLVAHTIRVAGGGEFAYLGEFVASSPSRNAALRAAFLQKNLGALGEVLAEAQRSLPANAKVLFVYEARPYLLERRIVYNTVFDDSELLRLAAQARSADEITSRLLEAGVTHVLVNVEELRRFIQQYARPAQLAALGIHDPVREFPLIGSPEDLYPPFSRSPLWPGLREPVRAWLRQMRHQAHIIRGHESAPVYLAPLKVP